MQYQPPSPYPQQPQQQPENKNFLPIIAISVLAVLCVVLSVLLVMNMSKVENDHTDQWSAPPPPPQQSVYNDDSVELVQLRDSLRYATPVSAGGNLYGAVFLEKMNVFYIGVDNPITIGVSGFDAADLSPSISGGSMSANGKPGSYIVRVSSGTKATITVAAKVNGANKTVATYEYRIKRVPDPVAYVGNVKGDGQMTKAELNATSGVFARMENFDFDLSFSVVSFVMTMNVQGVYVEKMANGPAITADMKTLVAGAKPGDRVMFNQITVKGPDGTLRKIPGVMIKVK